MPIYKTNGIILGRHNLGEADRIIAFVTPERGVVRAVAKGVRKIKSRMAGHLELFCESALMLAKGRNLDVITSVRLINHNQHLVTDYDRLRQAYLFAEIIQKVSGEEHHAGLYDLVQVSYRHLDGRGASSLLELWFKLRLLDVLGYKPDLAGCMICGKTDARQFYFNNELGGLVDEGCRTGDSLAISHDHIKLWRLALNHDFTDMVRVAGGEELAVGSLSACTDFYTYTFGRTFKSNEMIS